MDFLKKAEESIGGNSNTNTNNQTAGGAAPAQGTNNAAAGGQDYGDKGWFLLSPFPPSPPAFSHIVFGSTHI